MGMQAMGPRNRRVSLMANMKFAPIVEDMKENNTRKQYSLNPDAPAFQMNADGTYSMITPGPARRKPVFYAAEGPQCWNAHTQSFNIQQQLCWSGKCCCWPQASCQCDEDAQGSRQWQRIQQLVQTTNGPQTSIQSHPNCCS